MVTLPWLNLSPRKRKPTHVLSTTSSSAAANNDIKVDNTPHPLHKPFVGTRNHSTRKPEHGIWTCCKCNARNHMQLRPGKHPIGAVACRCPHRPCEDCRFSGSLRYFMPITDPLSIPRVDRHHSTTGDRMSEIPYGIVCKTCGLSWRAEEVRRARRVPSLKETFRDLQKNRLHPRGGRLQKSQSMLTLNASPKLVVEDSSSPIVRSTSIRLAGRKCTCGSVSSEDTFCFRIVTENELGNSLESSARYYREPSRVTDEELRAKGHHNSVLCIRNVVHPNPLRRNPVEL